MQTAYRLETYFQALELHPASTLEEVRQAYHDLVLVWHPDRFQHNPRLQQKAEEKVKIFNQAYQQLKVFYSQAAANANSSSASSCPPGTAARHRRTAKSPQPRSTWQCPTTRGLSISFAEANYILQQYTFRAIKSHQKGYTCYEGGPFRLLIGNSPLEFQLSVPCDSLQTFDRILLSIPCKSTGKFWQGDAQTLIELLQHHLE
jgi:hypothetical protein